MNLYIVYDAVGGWGCYVFETTRGRAKAMVAKHNGAEYTDMRCNTLKKGVNFPYPKTVDSDTDEGYDVVLACGHHYDSIDEILGDEDVWGDAE